MCLHKSSSFLSVQVLVEQQHAAEAAAAKSQEEILLSLLARKSAEEQRLAEHMWQLRQEKEVIRENRMLREEQYRWNLQVARRNNLKFHSLFHSLFQL